MGGLGYIIGGVGLCLHVGIERLPHRAAWPGLDD